MYEMCKRSVWMLNNGGGEKLVDIVAALILCKLNMHTRCSQYAILCQIDLLGVWDLRES